MIYKRIIIYSFLFLFSFVLIILLVSCEINAPNYIEASKGKYTDRIYLQWELVTDATSYNVYYAENENGYYSLIENSISTSTTYYPFYDGYYYYFKVSYIDENGKESEMSKPDYGYTAIPTDNSETGDENYNNSIIPGATSSMRSIHSNSDVDWFYFTAVIGKTYLIRTIYPNNDIYSYTNRETWVPADTSLYLYKDNGGNPAQDPIENNSDGGSPAGYSQISWQCTEGGTYYIKITCDVTNSSPEGWYQLSVTEIK